MTNEDALAVIFVSLETLVYRHYSPLTQGSSAMPIGLLREALALLDEFDVGTTFVRARFLEYGVDLSDISSDQREANTPLCADVEESNEEKNAGSSRSWRRTSWNKVPGPIRMAVLVKFEEGWTKSRIAREFRLNRRTVINICKGAQERSAR